MTMYRLSATALDDITEILRWTHETHGASARKRYETLLVTALRDVAEDPLRHGTTARPEVEAGVRSYHLRHSRGRALLDSGLLRKPRHLLLYRMLAPDLVGIGRVLHDSMDIKRHRPVDYGEDAGHRA